jgi:acyl transferase domain-containing protein/acyl carrier protein
MSPTALEIQDWLKARVAEPLGLAPEAVDPDRTFASHGLSSLAVVTLSGDLEDWLGLELPTTLAWDHPTLTRLAAHLATLVAPAAPEPTEPPLPVAEPIAIIGIGCRFPGADTLEAFWSLLTEGREAVTEVPAERWPIADFYDPTLEDTGKMNTRFGAFLSDIDRFDPGFFGLSPREAAAMDPQQRLLLEVSWQALEDAGLAPERLAGSPAGVFVGLNGTDYFQLMTVPPSRAGTGVANAVAANRLSYFYDLQGPSLAVDTACSSSLVAVHLACQSLATHESSLAIAGAVNLTLVPELTVALSQASMMSPEGRCKTFDASADGYVRGEGCAVVILKRLTDAERDGDRVLAVIRGSAVNHNGRSNGLTAPSGLAQQAVVRRALARAGVKPSAIGYVETHGSGTPLGDPIEVQALAAVLSEGRRPDQPPCLLGAVKTNVGHLEAAAGMAGLLKAVLALRHGQVPPNLHLGTPNPALALALTPFSLPAALTPWPSDGPRLAGVSSFGYGGTNAHVILSEAPGSSAPAPVPPDVVLALSAKSEAALRARAAAYRDRLADAPLAPLCRAAALRRGHYGHRLAIVASSTAELQDSLERYLAGEPDARRFVSAMPLDADPSSDPSPANWISAARRYVTGETPDWHSLFGPGPWPWVELPGHPFMRRRCWLGPDEIRTFVPEGAPS